MDEEKIQELLKLPGARRAADGVLVELEDGTFMHLTGFTRFQKGLEPHELLFTPFCSKKEILRLRELRTPHDYLLRLRANAIADSPRAVRVFAQRRKAYESNGREWSLTHYYHSMDRHHKSYVGLLSPAHRKTVKAIPSGMALVPEANAICVRSLAGDVVVASEALEMFYYFMTLGFYGNQFGLKLRDRICALVIAIRIINGAEALDFDLDSRGSLPQEVERATRVLVQGQMQFTFGHEFAHYIRGHLPSPFDRSEPARAEDSLYGSNEITAFDHNLEYEADLYAVRHIAGHPAEQQRIAQRAISVLMFLAFLEDTNTLHNVRSPRVLSTHPKPIDRAWRLCRSLGATPGTSARDLDMFIAVSQQLQEILGKALRRARRDILSFYGSLYLPGFVGKVKRDRIDF